MIKYLIWGAGWRSEFYIRVSLAYPEKFSVSGVYIRNPDTYKDFLKKYPQVKLYTNQNDALKTEFDFIVSCVSKVNMTDTILKLSGLGYSVLSETPCAFDKNTLSIIKNPEHENLKIQVAEQFRFMTLNKAIKRAIDLGYVGTADYAEISLGHSYHGMSLIRFFLDTRNSPVCLSRNILETNITEICGRYGKIMPHIKKSQTEISVYDFGNKKAVLNFSYDQYFSPFRKNRVLIRGEKGEITERGITALADGKTYSDDFEFKADGIYIRNNLLSKYSFPDLDSDHDAIAQVLVKMGEYVRTGKSFYSIYEEADDVSYALGIGGTI